MAPTFPELESQPGEVTGNCSSEVAFQAQPAFLSYVLITPARNEAASIGQTIESVVQQTVKPLRWVIVSDGSTDGTDDLVKKYAAAYRWIELVRMPERKERHFAGKVHAFNAGYARVKDLKFDIVGSLDADITFGPDYFDFLLAKFAANPRLGVGGTPFEEEGRRYDYRFTSSEHVSGACQLFRRECFEEIGGYVPIKIGGIDLTAVLTARMKGWQTRSFPEQTCTHHRTMGTAKKSLLPAVFGGGRGDYMLGSHPLWEFCRCLYQMTRQPVIVAGVTRMAGFAYAMVRREQKPISDELVQFRRAEQMRRLRAFLSRLRLISNRASAEDVQSGQRTGMRPLLSHRLATKLQKLFWVHLTKNGLVTTAQDFRIIEPKKPCSFIPITFENCHRVREFREEGRVSEYREKVERNEIGFFAECEGTIVGSIWGTLNKTLKPIVVRHYMPLMPNESVMHDVVTADHCRGMGIASFLVGSIAAALLNDYQVNRIILDVNVRNAPSLRMLEKAGVQIREMVLYVSAFGTLAFHKTLRRYAC